MDERQQLAKNLLDELASGDQDAAAAAIEQYAALAVAGDFDDFVDRAEEVFSAWPDRARPSATRWAPR